MNSPILSIIVPIYNVEKYIRPCIESLYRQNMKETDFEIILVNDGTKDHSVEMISDIINEHTNLTLINQKNQGISIARNNGLKAAKGAYIYFIDSDDILLCETLPALIKLAVTEQTDIIKGGSPIKLNNEQIKHFHTSISYPINKEIFIKTGEQAFIDDYIPSESYVAQNLYSTSFLQQNNLFFLEHKVFEDVAFSVETLLMAKKVAVLSTPFYIYRQHSNSIMSTMKKEKLLSMNDINEYIYNLQFKLTISQAARTKLHRTVFFNMISVNTWYLIHYQSLWKQKKEILYDMKDKISRMSLNTNIKQKIIIFCLKYFTNTYINIRYYFAKNKYH